jgi:hypothetical protein
MTNTTAIKRKLKPGAHVVYVGIMRPYFGVIKNLTKTSYGIQVQIELGDEPDLIVALCRHLVPKAAYKTRSFDGYTLMPYEWEI